MNEVKIGREYLLKEENVRYCNYKRGVLSAIKVYQEDLIDDEDVCYVFITDNGSGLIVRGILKDGHRKWIEEKISPQDQPKCEAFFQSYYQRQKDEAYRAQEQEAYHAQKQEAYSHQCDEARPSPTQGE